jgi:glycolate oxidase
MLTMLAFFPMLRQAGTAVANIVAEGLTPATLELMDRTTVDAIESAFGLGLPTGTALLMVETDQPMELAVRELEIAERICRNSGAVDVVRAQSIEEANLLRAARRFAHPALERRGRARMDDVAVPPSRVAELLESIESIGSRNEIVIGVFGHAGDGSFHPTYVVARDDVDGAGKIDSVRRQIYDVALALGGTITSEHGTGLAKKGILEAQVGSAAVEVMRALKSALDPQWILNPGKVFDRAGQGAIGTLPALS